MEKPKNIQIPLETFYSLIDTLEYIDVSKYDKPFQIQFEAVLDALRAKKKSMDAREAYSGLIAANKVGDEDKKFDARIDYLRKRN